VNVLDCNPGTYLQVKPKIAGGQCISCPSGYHKNTTGIQACQGCLAGFACSTASVHPEPCQPGFVTTQPLSSFCQLCPLGQYQPAATQTRCLDCSKGRFSNKTGSLSCFDCVPGQSAEVKNSVKCVACNSGRYTDQKNSSYCDLCPAGYSSDNETSTLVFRLPFTYCKACQPGLFSPTSGSIECDKCPRGKRTATEGMSVCGPCPSGTASGNENSRTCNICVPGQYAAGTGNDACNVCPAGYHARRHKSESCVLCTAGTACRTGTGEPEICLAGWFSANDGSQECQACTIGQASTHTFSTSCDICQPGTYSRVKNATECTRCKRGEFNEATAGNKCQACPRGWSTNVTGAAVCSECEMKYRSSLRDFGGAGEGSHECIACLLGEVQTPNSGQCFYCAIGTYSLYAGEQYIIQEMNENAKAKGLNHANCHLCPNGGRCRGGNALKALNGFWRSSNMSTNFTECFFKASCEGASWEDSTKDLSLKIEHNESCKYGYQGRLCHSCIEGWGRMTFDTCQVCPPKQANMALTVVGILVVLCMMVGFIIYSIKSSADESSTSSMMFKTLAAYGQVVGIASLFPYKWPKEIIKLFELLDMMTSVSDRILNTDCALASKKDSGEFPLVYEKAILYMMAPVIFAFCACVVFIITQYVLDVRCTHNKFVRLRKYVLKQGEEWLFSDTKRCTIVSVIVAMVILHPTLTRQSIFLLMCVEVEGAFYLRKDVQLQCSTTQHNLVVGLVAVPGILLYVIICKWVGVHFVEMDDVQFFLVVLVLVLVLLFSDVF
jgi:hypothetical protein